MPTLLTGIMDGTNYYTNATTVYKNNRWRAFIIFLNVKRTKVRSSNMSITNGESAHDRSMGPGE